MRVCPRCQKSREVKERMARKDGKSWRIESCSFPSCGFNFEIYEWPDKESEPNANPKRKTSWFRP
jgi:hypothetical protein